MCDSWKTNTKLKSVGSVPATKFASQFNHVSERVPAPAVILVASEDIYRLGGYK
ncbi:hypothetical protein ETAA8_28240 [Anatilimnocola aggregata]|uniref:Uncharacterized protein n=1 Tax=Anatilimnocola aggregata TaxID=2528021 RepID=A0A517YBY0_9BACT|nr:hypothetical protein ETAA8_28240 [Anatilimnocola aggregata]